MTCYVDPLREVSPSLRWPYHQICCLVGSSLNELHAMAGKLGLKKRWFKNQATLPHYCLTANKRQMALRLGAREVSWPTMKEIIQQSRVADQVKSVNIQCGPLGPPEEK